MSDVAKSGPKVSYSGTIQLGHLLVVGTVLASAFGTVVTGTMLYTDLVANDAKIETRVELIEDERVPRLQSSIDSNMVSVTQVRENTLKIDLARQELAALGATNRRIYDRLNDISENLASIRGRLGLASDALTKP